MYIDKFKLLHGDNQETKTKTQYAGAKIRRGLSLLYRNLLVCGNFVCFSKPLSVSLNPKCKKKKIENKT
jgi:hypothetical protein